MEFSRDLEREKYHILFPPSVHTRSLPCECPWAAAGARAGQMPWPGSVGGCHPQAQGGTHYGVSVGGGRDVAASRPNGCFTHCLGGTGCAGATPWWSRKSRAWSQARARSHPTADSCRSQGLTTVTAWACPRAPQHSISAEHCPISVLSHCLGWPRDLGKEEECKTCSPSCQVEENPQQHEPKLPPGQCQGISRVTLYCQIQLGVNL